MKVTLVNHSDIRGGASMASLRLMNALRQAGIDARMIVNHADGPGNTDIAVAGDNLRSKACFVAERVRIFAVNGFSRSRLFKVSTAQYGLPLHKHPWIADADIVVLNWINQGMMSLDGISHISRMGKPIVWVMHDMWPMTGICHLPEDCRRFAGQCGNCPQLVPGNSPYNDLSHKTWIRKRHLYEDSGIRFVAVSNWLARQAHDSSLLRDYEIEVIHNAFPIEDFSIAPTRSRSELGLPDDRYKLIIMCAARLDDPIKDLPTAIAAMNNAASRRNDIAAVFCGKLRDPEKLNDLRLPYKWLGTVNDKELLSEIYSHCSAVVSSSRFETLGYTLIEGMASGAIPVSFGNDGRDDIIDHLRTGYIAAKTSRSDLADGILWAIDSDVDRRLLRESVESRFSSHIIADKYLSLFKTII